MVGWCGVGVGVGAGSVRCSGCVWCGVSVGVVSGVLWCAATVRGPGRWVRGVWCVVSRCGPGLGRCGGVVAAPFLRVWPCVAWGPLVGGVKCFW